MAYPATGNIARFVRAIGDSWGVFANIAMHWNVPLVDRRIL